MHCDSLLKKEGERKKKIKVLTLSPTDFLHKSQVSSVPACVTGADGGAEAGAAVGA